MIQCYSSLKNETAVNLDGSETRMENSCNIHREIRLKNLHVWILTKMTFHSELQYYLRYIYINTAYHLLNISYCKKKIC
jgi:hypothetical protein